MTFPTNTERPTPVLEGMTAADLMSPNPVSIDAADTIEQALAFLADRNFNAAPVIDAAGRPIGVVSHADIMVHERERTNRPVPVERWIIDEEITNPTGALASRQAAIEDAAAARVSDVMTPAIFSVLPTAPAMRVVADMVALNVHQIYVVDEAGVPVGVISALDVLRHLRNDRPANG
jgi:CBS domain-containing protein